MDVGRGGHEEKREVRGAGVEEAGEMEEGDEVELHHEREQNHRPLHFKFLDF